MEKRYLKFKVIASFIFCASVTQLSIGQVQNNEINVGMKPDIIRYDGVNDLPGDLPGEGTFQSSITYEQSNYNAGMTCYTWSIPSTPNTHDCSSYTWDYQLERPFTETASLYAIFYENDVDPCLYNASSDDDYLAMSAEFSWGWNPPQTSFTNFGEYLSSRWRGDDQNPSSDNWLFGDHPTWDFKVKTAWRYSYGNACNVPLEFGEIQMNSTVSDKNSTSSFMINETPSAEGVLTYTNDSQGPSTDVFYSFYIGEPMEVTISTMNEYTSYDSYIYLYENECSQLITSNDDIEPGVLQSEIIQNLASGTYIIQVEGYDTSNGVFELNVSTSQSTLGLNSQDVSEFVKLFPNPAKDQVTLDFGNEFESANVQMIDLAGKIVFEKSGIVNQRFHFDLGEYQSGVYSIRVFSDSKVALKKLIIQ